MAGARARGEREALARGAGTEPEGSVREGERERGREGTKEGREGERGHLTVLCAVELPPLGPR